MKTEAALQTACLGHARSQGAIAGKVEMAGYRGWPDLLILFPAGHTWFVELKHPNGKGVLSKQQEKRRDEIRALNGDWSEIDNYKEFCLAFDERFRHATAICHNAAL